MALMFNPDPMPVEVISDAAVPDEAPVAEDAAETGELMNEDLCCACRNYRHSSDELKQDSYQAALSGLRVAPQACSSIRALEIPRLLASAGKAIIG